MPENNHDLNQEETISSASARSSIAVIEFNWPLFVYQRRAGGKGEYLFTIALWNGGCCPSAISNRSSLLWLRWGMR